MWTACQGVVPIEPVSTAVPATGVPATDDTGTYLDTLEHVADPDLNSIYMELGPTSMAACGDESLGHLMAAMFGPAQVYEFLDDGEAVRFLSVAGGPIYYCRNIAK